MCSTATLPLTQPGAEEIKRQARRTLLLKCLPLVHAVADPTIWETWGLGLALKVTFAGGTCAISGVPLLTYERRPVSAKRLSWCRFVRRDADAPQAVAGGGEKKTTTPESHLNTRQRLVGPNGVSADHVDPVVVHGHARLVLT